ncbi:MAG: sugar transferase [Clostridia bacterium]|nr:sugar transferase [Clostridia bacterium]
MYWYVKRALDIVLSLFLLILLSPLLLGIYLILAVTTKGQPIFRQQRAGRFSHPFYMYKFRTMYPDAPPNMPTMDFKDANRYVTPFGHLLRYTSLDELPQLWNILKGDMSFIGPRPVVLAEVELLLKRKRLRADQVRPGLTGLAQVRGRDDVDIQHKARYDAYYIDHFSFWLDVKILIQTVFCLVTHRGLHESRPEDSDNTDQKTS